MLLYRPIFRDQEKAARPANLAEAEALAPGVTPVYPDRADLMVDVETPQGEKVAIDDSQLIEMLRKGIRDSHQLTLLRSDRAMTDCRPVSIFSIQTVRQLGQEVGQIWIKGDSAQMFTPTLARRTVFTKMSFVSHTLRIGGKATIAVMDRDPRCKMITLDPDTAEPNPEISRRFAKAHEGKAGIYAAVLVEARSSQATKYRC